MRGVGAGVVALALALAGCGGSEDEAADPAPSSSGPAQVTELDDGAVGIADVGGEPWLVQVDAGTVLPGTGDPVEVGRAPLRIVDTPGGVWVSVIQDGTVVRIDPDSGQVDTTVHLKPGGSEPEGLAWDGSHLWVVDQAGGRVVELDADGGVVASYATDDEPRLVAAGDSGIWVANYGGTSVTRVADGKVRTAHLTSCSGPQGIAETAGRVWVSCTLSGKAIALDAGTMKQVAEVPGIPDADAVVADGDTVYVVGQTGPTVYVIDSAAGTLTDTVRLDDAPPTSENVGAAVVGEDLVVTHPDVRRVYTWPLP
ncbi:hypothetical protein [Nocardioides sp.]|uniref:hypothetical protein n=1 Tax=Nocardioides sp. TaxID=35761 RepID=UPI003783B1A6